MSRILTDDQKRTWLDISRYLLSHYEDDPGDFIKRVVTKDETWVHHLDQESKMKNKQWEHPDSSPPKKYKMAHSAGKVVASIFWDVQGVIMIDKRCILCRLVEAARPGNRKKGAKKTDSQRSVLAGQRPWSHVAMTAAIECGFEILPHSPCSSDMAPSDFYLFPKMKFHLRGTRNGSNEGNIEQ